MAQKFVKDLSVTTIRGQVSHSETGAWCGGTPPFGFDLRYHDSTGTPYQRVRWMESGDKELYDAADKLVRILPRGERITSSKKDVAKLYMAMPEELYKTTGLPIIRPGKAPVGPRDGHAWWVL